MIPAIHTALSGLSGFSKKIEVTAHNVANVNTDGYRRSDVDVVEVETGGVLPVIEKDNAEGPTVLKDIGQGPEQVQLSNVDLGREVIDLIIGQRGFEANLRTLTTADAMLGSILDIRK